MHSEPSTAAVSWFLLPPLLSFLASLCPSEPCSRLWNYWAELPDENKIKNKIKYALLLIVLKWCMSRLVIKRHWLGNGQNCNGTLTLRFWSDFGKEIFRSQIFPLAPTEKLFNLQCEQIRDYRLKIRRFMIYVLWANVGVIKWFSLFFFL